MKNISKFSVIALFFLASIFKSGLNMAQTYPSGFSQVLVANGISNPTVFSFAPDGRTFVAQQNGQLRVIKNGTLLATPFVSLSVNSSGERGLLGIAFDPNFAINKYIYVYYTLSSAANNRISRFTANGDVALAGSELVILELDPLSGATNHNGGTMQFGLDGKLYVGIGENANTSFSQNLSTYHGKVLRLNTDGTAPSDNPFFSNVNVKTKRIWSYGLRNPYTLSVQPGTGRIFVNDVGQNTWEEINDATVGGRNFGWPTAEGNSGNSSFTNPIYAYNHNIGGCAITGGTFFNPTSTNYPASYIGQYFYLDYCSRWIDALTLSGSSATNADFATNIAGSAVNMATGPDGNLYFLSRSAGALYRISYAAPTSPPTITSQPQNASVGLGNPANFSVTATGSQPLFYQWRKGGNNIIGANLSSYSIANTTIADAGTFSVIVSYGTGTPSTTSNIATLSVTQPNQKPTAAITSPIVGTTYAGSQVIQYAGTGSDPESGNLPASSFTWFIDFHHDSHTHPGMLPTSGSSSGNFTIPNSGETATNVWYRIYLIVRDPQGLKDTTFRDVFPRLSNITINTNPQGLKVALDGQLFTAPYTTASVHGIIRNIGVLSPQGNYTFGNWNHGGANYQDIATPITNISYTANMVLAPAVTLIPTSDTYVHAGTSANRNFGTATTLITKSTTDNNWKRETLIRFDISGFTFPVGSARLRLFAGLSDNNNPSVRVDVKEIPQGNAWQENTVTWNTKPAELAPVLAFQTVAGVAKKYYEWDLTSFIIAQKALGRTFINLKLINPTNTASRIDFHSKEASTNRPQLVITPSASLNRLAGTGTFENPTQVLESVFLYPNPAKNVLFVDLNEITGKAKAVISDLSGRLIETKEFEADKILDLNISSLKQGVYFLHLQTEMGKISRRFVVQ